MRFNFIMFPFSMLPCIQYVYLYMTVGIPKTIIPYIMRLNVELEQKCIGTKKKP